MVTPHYPHKIGPETLYMMSSINVGQEIIDWVSCVFAFACAYVRVVVRGFDW